MVAIFVLGSVVLIVVGLTAIILGKFVGRDALVSAVQDESSHS